jgi:hypothetical protein
MSSRALAVGLLLVVSTGWASPHKKHKRDKVAAGVPARQTEAATEAGHHQLVAVLETEPPPPANVAPPAVPLIAPPAPAVEYERPPRRWGMFGGGVALWAAAYAADVGVTFGFHHDPGTVALVPLVGPLIQLGDKYGYQGPLPMTGNATLDAQMAQQIAQANTLIQTVTYVGLALDFAGQLTGITLALVGALSHQRPSSATSVRVAATANGFALRF